MATANPVKSISGKKLLVQIGDGASPDEVFASDCMINAERGLALSVDSNDFVIPDCDDPDAAGWKEREVDGMSGTISGSGMLHTTSFATWFNWMESAAPKRCRVTLDVTAANGGGYVEGLFFLTSFEVKGSRNDKVTADVTLDSTGILTWTDAA
ncbi:phage tail tube protein [Consotaella salsifontis]|uniref:Phage tail tube protein n=1 Tax=Consotaella salsifontis TaxID=1365950 RepID=A0A1T4ST13_9HYPH|nr:phage tail tube protein [Consotaella salsifontis]SKA31018.1 Phage tail tube protein [Consotaella salsifontis]